MGAHIKCRCDLCILGTAGTEIKDSIKLSKLYDKLLSTDKVTDVTGEICTSVLLGISDFSISMAFTSPTLDALGLGKPSTFFVSGGRFTDCIFSASPGLLSRSTSDIYASYKYFAELGTEGLQNYFQSRLPLSGFIDDNASGISRIVDYIDCDIESRV